MKHKKIVSIIGAILIALCTGIGFSQKSPPRTKLPAPATPPPILNIK